MPIVQITTNLPKSRISSDFVKKASALAAKLTSGNETNFELIVQPDQIISFSGTQDPAALVTFTAVGISEERRKSISKSFHDFLVAELGFKSNRFYIVFNGINTNEAAFGGRLYSEILSGKH